MNKLFFHLLLFGFLFSSSFNSNSQSVNSLAENSYDLSIKRFSEALRIRTISSDDPSVFDSSAFRQMKNFLEKSFPFVHANLERTCINEFGYIYRWEGIDKNKDPLVLLAHQDVVPVEEAAEKLWTYPAFSGAIKNDTVWGRGAVDDKGTLIAILEAAENLLQNNQHPLRTVYFCFGHDEETSGHYGAESIAKWFSDRNIHPFLVLDEGLEIIHKNYIPLKTPVALIGVGEKGYATFEVTSRIEGGHSAAPKRETAITILSDALKKVNDDPMPAVLINTVNLFLTSIKNELPGKMRFAISNLWLFKKKLLKEMAKNNGTNSLIRTTIVTTMINSGVKDNVIPSFATATINCRILPGETVEEVENFLTRQINDERIFIKRTSACWNPPPMTSTESGAYKLIDSLTKKIFPQVVTAPLFVVGTTDARFFRSLSEGVINFIPVFDSKGMHGVDERRSINDYLNLIFFFEQLMLCN
ncbi:MAG TPA: M20/M25/M40 family metallo-hydrolase [Chitinophagaceae bacterium]|nr:M20/M25/M40 family metallo-hydrolase [Chitinophagaceae bacterium]